MLKKSKQWHSDLPPGTVYAYGQTLEEATVPSSTVLTARDVAISMNWENNILDREPFYPVDYTLDIASAPSGGVPIGQIVEKFAYGT